MVPAFAAIADFFGHNVPTGTYFDRPCFGSRLTRWLRGSTDQSPEAMEGSMARSAARSSISTLALLALAACVQTTTATAPTPPPAIAATAVPINPDQDFLNRAMTGTGAQVELGRLAQQHGMAPS